MTGPLAPYADAYQAELRGRGYTALSAVNQLRQVGRLSAWLAANGTMAVHVSVERVDEFLEQQRAQGRRASWSRPALVGMVELLRSLGVVGPERTGAKASAQARLLGSFERYLLAERGLAPGTVRGYLDHARRFLAGLDPAAGLGAVAAAEVTAAVLRESGGVSVAAAQNFVAGLRSFLRFCLVEGLVALDLSEAARRHGAPGQL